MNRREFVGASVAAAVAIPVLGVPEPLVIGATGDNRGVTLMYSDETQETLSTADLTWKQYLRLATGLPMARKDALVILRTA